MSSSVPGATDAVAPFIEGVLCESSSDATVEATDPSTGRRLLSLPAGCEADVQSALHSSRRAFEQGRWSDLPPTAKKKILHRFADLIAAQAATLDALDAGEMGKPVSLAFGGAAKAAELMRFHAEAVDKVMGDVYSSDKDSIVIQRRVPRGVVAAVTPWNFPTSNTVRKIAPALATGNCVVLKPSELASRSALRLAHLAMEAGLPAGVFNVVPGLGTTVGQALALHMDVDMLTFTGSTEVGKQMLKCSALSNMKPVMAECGGKSPQVVFDDGVDLTAAAAAIAGFLLTNQGQICSVGSRLLVQRSIETSLLEKVTAHLERVVMGAASDPRTTFGPLASSKQCERVMRYIETAEADGCRLLAGGRRALPHSGGYFVEPTVFRDVPPTARIAQEEIFGPVLAVTAFDDEAEAIRIANGTPYGLASYVWTTNLATGMRVAKALRSSVWVNAAAPKSEGAGNAASFEPFGQSGIGTESGLAGMESYLCRQHLAFNYQ